MNRKKIIIGSAASVALILFGSYLANALYLRDKLLPGTNIEGIDCSYKTIDEVNQLLMDKHKNTKFSILEGTSESLSFTGSNIGLDRDLTNELSQVREKQNSLTWPLGLISKKALDEETSNLLFNEDAFNTYFSSVNLNKGNRLQSNDAFLNRNNTNFIITEEVYGNTLNVETAINKIKENIKNGADTIDISDCYEKPKVTKNDEKLISLAAKANDLKKINIEYKFGTRREVASDVNKMDMITYDGNDVYFDKSKVNNYVVSLAQKYDTYGSTRSFKSTRRGVVNVTGGVYGWYILTESETEELYNQLLEGNDISRVPNYDGTIIKNEDNDIGSTYIEVDILNQHLWFYKNGALLVEGDVVTGNASNGHDTPKGVHYVWSKESPSILKGQDYETRVEYWMPIEWTGVGIHDAIWRNPAEFGKNTYLTNGSHGCINSPLILAKTIYENVEIGTPVIVF